jgi:hypothetical protein
LFNPVIRPATTTMPENTNIDKVICFPLLLISSTNRSVSLVQMKTMLVNLKWVEDTVNDSDKHHMSTKEIFERPGQRASTRLEMVVELGMKNHVCLITMPVNMMWGEETKKEHQGHKTGERYSEFIKR